MDKPAPGETNAASSGPTSWGFPTPTCDSPSPSPGDPGHPSGADPEGLEFLADLEEEGTAEVLDLQGYSSEEFKVELIDSRVYESLQEEGDQGYLYRVSIKVYLYRVSIMMLGSKSSCLGQKTVENTDRKQTPTGLGLRIYF